MRHPVAPDFYQHVVLSVFNFRHYDRCVVVSLCSFNLHCPEEQWCWALFCMLIGYAYMHGCEVFIQILCLLFIGLFYLYYWVARVLYILWLPVLHQVCFPNTISQSMVYLLTLLMMTFDDQFFIWWSLSDYSFLLLLFLSGSCLIRLCLPLGSEDILLYFHVHFYSFRSMLWLICLCDMS